MQVCVSYTAIRAVFVYSTKYVVVRLIFVEARDVCIPQDSIGTMIAMMAAVFCCLLMQKMLGQD